MTSLGIGQGTNHPFPLVVLDFEATALTLYSYPIEVGIARADAPTAPISGWSSLIAPDPAWGISEQWDPDAERIHGITRWQLRGAPAAGEVMIALNSKLGQARRVWCDGGTYDAHWLRTLAEAAGIEPSFELEDIATLLGTDGIAAAGYRQRLAGSRPPHRAGPDAERICAALAAEFHSDSSF